MGYLPPSLRAFVLYASKLAGSGPSKSSSLVKKDQTENGLSVKRQIEAHACARPSSLGWLFPYGPHKKPEGGASDQQERPDGKQRRRKAARNLFQPSRE